MFRDSARLEAARLVVLSNWMNGLKEVPIRSVESVFRWHWSATDVAFPISSHGGSSTILVPVVGPTPVFV
jgi:hypothetical protein